MLGLADSGDTAQQEVETGDSGPPNPRWVLCAPCSWEWEGIRVPSGAPPRCSRSWLGLETHLSVPRLQQSLAVVTSE